MSPLLRYTSVPSNISAYYDETEIPDQSEIEFPPGTAVILKVPRYVKTVGDYQIIIDGSRINEELTDFPLMVKITDPAILSHDRKHISIKTEGSECYVEIESWDTSEAILWVKVPRIYASVDTVLTLSLLASQNPYIGDTLDPVTINVWSNGYVGVFHLAGNAYDSSPERNHGIIHGIVSFVPAKVGLGAEFIVTSVGSPAIEIPDHPNYSPVNNNPWTAPNGIICGRICVQIQWNPVEDWPGEPYMNWKVPLRKGDPGIEYKFNVFGSYETYGGRRFYVLNPTGGYGSGADIGERSGHLPTEPGRWYLLHGQTFLDPSGGGKVALYQDATPGYGVWGVGGDVDQDIGFNNYAYGDGVTGGTPIQMEDTDGPLWIGNTPSQIGPPDSIIDEVRVSRVNRNMAWMKAEYHNMNGELVQITSL